MAGSQASNLRLEDHLLHRVVLSIKCNPMQKELHKDPAWDTIRFG